MECQHQHIISAGVPLSAHSAHSVRNECGVGIGVLSICAHCHTLLSSQSTRSNVVQVFKHHIITHQNIFTITLRIHTVAILA